MSDIELMGAVYVDVPAVNLPKQGGGTVRFTDTSDATATADKILQGFTAYGASGEKLEGTATEGGGGGKNVQIAHDTRRRSGNTYADTGLNLTVAKTGIYDVYWTGWRQNTSGTNGSQLTIDGVDYGDAQETYESSPYNTWQHPHISNVSLTQGQIVSLKVKSTSVSYYMYVMDLVIIES